MILNRRRMKHPNRFTATAFIPPSQYSQCSSTISSYSESLSGDALYNQNTRMTYSTTQSHVPQKEHRHQMYSDSDSLEIHLSQDTDAETGSNVRIISDQSLKVASSLTLLLKSIILLNFYFISI